ncbi:glycine receptor subunit alpha-2-like [Brevipalpus obovatus]|uniref:glycine receptor subunit alpha-2-like n=1 Tax=Brevipalpus obovatus TaxID=246614 RepID=UPI003D9EC667
MDLHNLLYFVKAVISYCFLIYCVWIPVSCQDLVGQPDNEWSLDQLIPSNYRKLVPPRINGDPTKINISLSINQLISANEAEQSLTFDLLYEQSWLDQRIEIPKGFEAITLDSSWKNRLWVPNLYFINSLHSTPIDIKSQSLFLEVSERSQFVLSTRLIVKLGCHMNLFRFPQDTQICSIDLACVDWNNASVHFVWHKFEINERDDFPKYEITDYRLVDCVSIRGPDFPCLSVRLRLFRRFSYYLIRIYGPSLLLVLTAFVGFWVPAMGYPARIMIIVTPLLTLVTQSAQINSEINVSYVVALHIWMMSCIFFVFMALVEYIGAIIYVHTLEDKKEMNARHPSYGLVYSSKTNYVNHSIKVILRKVYGDIDWSRNPLDRNKVDYCARIVFPLFYILFVIVYSCIFVFPWLGSKYLL